MPNNRTLTHSLKEKDTTAPSRQRATRSSRRKLLHSPPTSPLTRTIYGYVAQCDQRSSPRARAQLPHGPVQSKAGKCLTGATFAFLRQDLHARWQFFSVQNPYLFYLDTFSALVPNLLEPEAR